jgi:uncharacterized protein DUF5715
MRPLDQERSLLFAVELLHSVLLKPPRDLELGEGLVSLWLAEQPISEQDWSANVEPEHAGGETALVVPRARSATNEATRYPDNGLPVSLSGPPSDEFGPAQPNLGSYRAGVADLVAEVRRCEPADASSAERILARHIGDDPFATVLAATPAGLDSTIAQLLFEIRNFERSSRSTASGVAGHVRLLMLTQIEAVWWGRQPGYRTDDDLLDSAELVDLDELDADGTLRFCYRHQATSLASRAVRAAQRRAMPGRSPRTAGLRLALATPEVVAWLNQIAAEFERHAPDGTPPLWVTSLTRSVAYQRHLRSLGYSAPLPSAHCAGYAADIEMTWYRKFQAHRLLRGLLRDHQRAGEVNVIDEGQAWHVCLSPALVHGQA